MTDAHAYDRGTMTIISAARANYFTMEQMARLFERGADYIEQYGWVQGTGGNEGQGLCTMGSVTKVFQEEMYELMGSRNADFPQSVTEEMLRRIYPYESVPSWNDAPGRTAQDVLLFMRGMAAFCNGTTIPAQPPAPVETTGATNI